MGEGQDTGSARATGRRDAWVVGILVALAFALRLYKCNESWWLDEISTYQVCSGGFASIFQNFASRSMPLYFVLARCAMFIGDAEFVPRIPSILAGVALVPVMYAAGKRLGGAPAATIAATLTAVSPYFIRYSQESRFYALLALLGFAATWFLVVASEDGGARRWLAFAATAVLGVTCHIFFNPYLAAMGIAAALWIPFARRVEGKRARFKRFAVLVCCGAAAVSVFAGLTVWDTQFGDNASQITSGGMPVNDEGETAESFRLTPGQYAGYVMDFLNFGPPLAPYALLILVAFGWLSTVRRSFLFAAISVLYLAVVPVPFMLVPLPHWVESRYFIVSGAVLIVLSSVGAGAIIQWVAHKAGPRLAAPLTACVIVALLGCAYTGLREHFKLLHNPDWKSLAHEMAAYASPDDVFLYFEPRGRWTVLNRPVQFYLARRTAPKSLVLLNEHNVSNEQDLASALRLHPESNVWLVTQQWADPRMPQPLRDAVNALFPDRRVYGQAVRYVLAQPAVNYIYGADFDSRDVSPGDAQQAIVNRTDSAENDRCLRLHTEGFATATATFPVKPMTYPLRNAGFDVWDEDRPVGWTVETGKGFMRGTSNDKTGAALTFPPNSERIILSQRMSAGLAPGRTVTVTARGLASAPEQLALGLRYRAGAEEKIVWCNHPGSGAWETMSLTAEMPQDADPQSIAVLAAGAAAAQAPASIDDVALLTNARPGELDPLLHYTLSLDAKLDNVVRGANGARVFRVDLVARDAAGKDLFSDVLRMDGSADWRRYVFSIAPGADLPAGAHDLRVVVGLRESQGTCYIDNVQLTPTDRVLPRIANTTLPHDEALAALGL